MTISEADGFSQLLRDRGYPASVVSQARLRFNVQFRSNLLKENRPMWSKPFTFALQYTPLPSAIKRVMYKYWYLVEPFLDSSLPRMGYKNNSAFRIRS